MIYRRIDYFKRAFQALPSPVQVKVRKTFKLFAQDPKHPSLGVKKIKGHREICEGRIGRQYRFTFHHEKDAEGQAICVLRNVDNHDECPKNP
jgi:hypothetical protein